MTSPNPRDAALGFIVAKGIATAASTAEKRLRAEAEEVFRRGDRLTVESPYDDGTELGTVTMTKPAPVAAVTDETAFVGWMADRYPDQCDDEVSIDPACMADAIAYLAEHAPDYLTRPRTVVRPWAREAVLKLSLDAGQPIGPGGECDADAPAGVAVNRPKPTVQVRLTPNAVPTVGRMLADGIADSVLPALPEAAA